MGRPPCCDKVGIKRGPWTPEEDIILVSYIQEHGPGNWRSVPTNTGLLRCSKSCRLRWTNYLRPGIKRGNFTSHEEGMIIHLQALLGNKWAAIASYLPQRTDNDIKNYWNTHLKKKLKKFQPALEPPPHMDSTPFNSHIFSFKSLLNSTTDIASATATPPPVASSLISRSSSSSTTCASSTENISRLLERWMRSSPKPKQEKLLLHNNKDKSLAAAMSTYHRLKADYEGGIDGMSPEELDSILSFENISSCGIGRCWDKLEAGDVHVEERKMKSEDNNNNHAPPLTFLEKRLLNETGGATTTTSPQVEEIMEP